MHTACAADLSQYQMPLHRLPSSCAAQSASVLHWQTDKLDVQLLFWQVSLAVQGLPSSHALPSAIRVIWHLPVLGWHRFCSHGVLSTVGQLGIDAGLTRQRLASLSQYSVPLHKLPSSNAAQSLSSTQAHRLAPETQLPPTHASLCEHKSPSSQGLPSCSAAGAHLPVAGVQTDGVHGLSV